MDENLATCLRMTDEAAAGAEVVVLPEFSNHVSWYSDRDHARSKGADPGRPLPERPR